MTRREITAWATKRYGKKFIAQLAKDAGFSFSSVSRMLNGDTSISRRMELEIERLQQQDRHEAK